MKRIATTIAAIAAAVGIAFGVTAYAPKNVDMSSVTAVIDVRTPEEFATGHLDGAVNIDWQGATFFDEIAQFDPAGTYVIYCRSGNRAGQAIDALADMGYTNLTNAGGVNDAAALTDLAVVQ
ncbi:MAG: rhodanese-like domain-containing protein [Microbacteriaceae bacterium]|nr:rhodanese-like domain-containing protein [Microbacteriaceae bacterium]